MKDIQKLDQALKALFEKKRFPGVSVALWNREGPVFQKGYGFGDLEKQRSVDEDTIFGVASMSKSMTALSCCLLAAEGKLSWDDPVTRYFPSFRLEGTPHQAVTLHHLAAHNAGIPPMEPLEWSIAMHCSRQDAWNTQLRKTAPNGMDTIDQIIDYIASCGYESLGAPGEVMSYCNEGYAILSYVVDQAAGMPLEAFLKERVFEPLGMTRSVLDLDASEAKAISGGNITSLFELEDGKLTADDDWSVLPPFRGCAQVRSTARDMAVYYRCLANQGMHEGKQVFPREAVEMLIGREFPVQAKPVYCRGLYKRKWKDSVICEHAGALHGVSTYGALLPEEGWGMAALCNQGDVSTEEFVWTMINWILDLPLEEKQIWLIPQKARFENPEMIVGSYMAREGVPSIARVYLQDGDLCVEHESRKGKIQWCGGTLFALFDEEGGVSERMEALIRHGKAWGMRCGSRVYSRIEE